MVARYWSIALALLVSSCGATATLPPAPSRPPPVACDASRPLTVSDVASHSLISGELSGVVDVGDLDGNGTRELLCVSQGRLSLVSGESLAVVEAPVDCEGAGTVIHVPPVLIRTGRAAIPYGTCLLSMLEVGGRALWTHNRAGPIPAGAVALGDPQNDGPPVVVVQEGHVLIVEHWPVPGIRAQLLGASFATPVVVADLDRAGGPEIVYWHVQSDSGGLSVFIANPEASERVSILSSRGEIPGAPIDMRVEELDRRPTIVTLHEGGDSTDGLVPGELMFSGLLPEPWICRVRLLGSEHSRLWMSFVDVDDDARPEILAGDQQGRIWPIVLDAAGCGVRGAADRATRELLP